MYHLIYSNSWRVFFIRPTSNYDDMNLNYAALMQDQKIKTYQKRWLLGGLQKRRSFIDLGWIQVTIDFELRIIHVN
jgi:hypothetical protein